MLSKEGIQDACCEQNFDYNISNHQNIIKFKKSSDEFFSNNIKMFDVVYIDGYHFGPQVYKDCENAWKCLKENGLLICDDYTWNFYLNIKDNPCYAINNFLTKIKGEYKIEKVSNFNLQSDRSDFISTFNTVSSDMQLYREGKLDQDKIDEYKSLAKNNGFQTIESFMNEYLPLLKSQIPEGS